MWKWNTWIQYRIQLLDEHLNMNWASVASHSCTVTAMFSEMHPRTKAQLITNCTSEPRQAGTMMSKEQMPVTKKIIWKIRKHKIYQQRRQITNHTSQIINHKSRSVLCLKIILKPPGEPWWEIRFFLSSKFLASLSD